MNQEELGIAQRIASELMGWKRVSRIMTFAADASTVFVLDPVGNGETRLVVGKTEPITNEKFLSLPGNPTHLVGWCIWRPFDNDWLDIINQLSSQQCDVGIDWCGKSNTARCSITGNVTDGNSTFNVRINQVAMTPGEAVCNAAQVFLEWLEKVKIMSKSVI